MVFPTLRRAFAYGWMSTTRVSPTVSNTVLVMGVGERSVRRWPRSRSAFTARMIVPTPVERIPVHARVANRDGDELGLEFMITDDELQARIDGYIAELLS